MSADAIIGALDVALGTAYHPVNVDVPYRLDAAPRDRRHGRHRHQRQLGGSSDQLCLSVETGRLDTPRDRRELHPISADIGGHAITCVVTATNATGSKAAPPSNPILT